VVVLGRPLAGVDQRPDLPGFPAGSYLGWMTPAVVLMAAMFGAGHSALGLVRDLQTGFLDRLRLLPIRPAALRP
jgi:ABC-2 type transport system permease protein